MIKFKAEIASSNEPKDGFTEIELDVMVEKSNKFKDQFKTITIDFDDSRPVGKVESLKRDGNKVFITGKIDPGFKGLFIVPGGIKNPGEVIITQFSITDTPTDKSISPIEYIV